MPKLSDFRLAQASLRGKRTKNSVATFQREFGALLRRGVYDDGDDGALVSKRAGLLYQSLVKNSILSFPRQCFGRLQAQLAQIDAGLFDALCDEFVAKRQMQSPYFTDINGEFAAFIGEIVATRLPAHIADLAQLEWVELLADIVPNSPTVPILRYDDVPDLNVFAAMRGKSLHLNSSLQLLECAYPVHTIDDETPPNLDEAPTFLAVYRHTDGVKVHALSPVMFVLLQYVQSCVQDNGANAPLFADDKALLSAFLPLVGAEFAEDDRDGTAAAMRTFLAQSLAELVLLQMIWARN